MSENLRGKKVLLIVEDAFEQVIPRMSIAQNALNTLPAEERADYSVHHVETKRDALGMLANQRRGGFQVVGMLLDNDFPHVAGEDAKENSGIGIIRQMAFANDSTPVMLNTGRLNQETVGKLAEALKVQAPALAEGENMAEVGHVVAIKKGNEMFPAIQQFFEDAIDYSRGKGIIASLLH